MVLYQCDLCGEIRDCVQKQIEGLEYDLCTNCWDGLEQKLKGKGRKKRRDSVFLSPPPEPATPERIKPETPGRPPDIVAGPILAN